MNLEFKFLSHSNFSTCGIRVDRAIVPDWIIDKVTETRKNGEQWGKAKIIYELFVNDVPSKRTKPVKVFKDYESLTEFIKQ